MQDITNRRDNLEPQPLVAALIKRTWLLAKVQSSR